MTPTTDKRQTRTACSLLASGRRHLPCPNVAYRLHFGRPSIRCTDMAAVNPRRITGRWITGVALYIHTLSSTYLGVNEHGHDVFDIVRSEFGELLVRLKYKGDRNAAPEIIAAAVKYLGPSPQVRSDHSGTAIDCACSSTRDHPGERHRRRARRSCDRLHHDDARGHATEGNHRPETPPGTVGRASRRRPYSH